MAVLYDAVRAQAQDSRVKFELDPRIFDAQRSLDKLIRDNQPVPPSEHALKCNKNA